MESGAGATIIACRLGSKAVNRQGMMDQRPSKTGVIRDFRRLIHVRDLLYHVGNLLYRRSLRYTGFTAAVAVAGVFTKAAGLSGLTVRQALTLPVLVGVATLLGGLLLKTIPSLISSRQLVLAQASDLNLMEDYRKSLQDHHLEILWQRVFQYEWPFRTDQCDPGETPHACFLRLARYGLSHPLPQTRQRHQIGFDLHSFEDWRDGGFFDSSDTKLREQFDGDVVLGRVKQTVPRRWRSLARDLPRRLAQRFWFALAMRAMAVETAIGVWTLNSGFDTDLFNSQVLLWPGEEDQQWVRDIHGGREEILRRRAIVIRRIFGPGPLSARVMIRRMFGLNLRRATRLRIDFDPEYCTGALRFNLKTDLVEAGWSQRRIERYSRRARQIGRDRQLVEAWLADHRPDLFEPAQAEALRAVRIALHVRPRLRRAMREAAGRLAPDSRWGRRLLATVDDAIASRHRISRMLVCLRLHHELTRLEQIGYETLIQDLRDSLST